MGLLSYLKIVVLIAALAGVLLLMKRLNSPDQQKIAKDPNSIMGILLGSDLQLYNWCPPEVEKIEIYSNQSQALIKSVNSPQDISALCELMIGTNDKGPMDAKFDTKLKAYSKKDGEVVTLESVFGQPLYRVKGASFYCKALDKALNRLEK